jgi:hypothetical protein
MKRLDFVRNFAKHGNTLSSELYGKRTPKLLSIPPLPPPPSPPPLPPSELGRYAAYVQASGISQCSGDPWPRLPSIYISQLKGQSHEISLMGINSREACIF